MLTSLLMSMFISSGCLKLHDTQQEDIVSSRNNLEEMCGHAKERRASIELHLSRTCEPSKVRIGFVFDELQKGDTMELGRCYKVTFEVRHSHATLELKELWLGISCDANGEFGAGNHYGLSHTRMECEEFDFDEEHLFQTLDNIDDDYHDDDYQELELLRFKEKRSISSPEGEGNGRGSSDEGGGRGKGPLNTMLRDVEDSFAGFDLEWFDMEHRLQEALGSENECTEIDILTGREEWETKGAWDLSSERLMTGSRSFLESLNIIKSPGIAISKTVKIPSAFGVCVAATKVARSSDPQAGNYTETPNLEITRSGLSSEAMLPGLPLSHCQMDVDGCVTGGAGNYQYCDIRVLQDGVINSKGPFNVEACCDHLWIGGSGGRSGERGQQFNVTGPTNVAVWKDSMIHWSSDPSVVSDQWTVCWSENTAVQMTMNPAESTLNRKSNRLKISKSSAKRKNLKTQMTSTFASVLKLATKMPFV